MPKEDYPLAPLLAVRHFREENAKRAVRTAEAALVEASDRLRQCQEELNSYRAWLPEEEDRRYLAIMGKPMTLSQLDAFKAGLGKLRDGELSREQAVFSAQAEREKKVLERDAASAAAAKAQKETAKIAAHKDIWLAEYKKEAERQEEKELEDFKPISFFGAEGEDS